jgi:enoyl-CoA hydratase/carnithine racemase
MSDRVTIDIEDGVADVRMNRPDKMNALDGAQFAAIVEAGESLKGNAAVRAVVLSGEGRAFCAGLDFGSFQQMAGGGGGGGEKPAWVWHELEVPVIAAVHGVALGGGAQIALGPDIRIVAPDVKFSILEIRWGLVPDMIGTYMLPRLVGLERAKELTWTGRMIDGHEMVQLGLATKVADDPRAAAFELAAELASKNPHAVRGGKMLLDRSLDATPAEQFDIERKTIGSLIGSPNQVEAVMAYFEKRDPTFAD